MIVRPTRATRTTVTEEFREIEPSFSFEGLRKVQLLVPASPATYLIITPDPRFSVRDGQIVAPESKQLFPAAVDDEERSRMQRLQEKFGYSVERLDGSVNVAKHAGYGRIYKGILLTPNASIVFHLLPEQALWAACEEGYSELGIICEYLPAAPGGNL